MERNKTIDIMKAIGIIFMVLGHSGFIYRRWIYQFHMAMFFIITGFCYNEKYSSNIQNLKKLIIKRLKFLYVPCLVWNLINVLLHNVFVEIYFIDANKYSLKKILINIVKCFLFSGGESLSGTTWFLRTMFFSTILYALLNLISNKLHNNGKEKIKWCISILLLIIGWKSYNNLLLGKYFNIFSVIILYQIGFSLKKIELDRITMKKNILLIISGFIAITLPMIFEKQNIALNVNKIINPIYFIWNSFGGTVMCFGISNIMSKCKVASFMSWIGQRTLPIVLFHLVSMKLVTLIQIIYYKNNIDLLKSYPYLYSSSIWSYIYTLVGTIIPLILYKIYNVIKNKIKITVEE